MTTNSWIELGVYLTLLLLFGAVFGYFMSYLFDASTESRAFSRRIENRFLRWIGVNPHHTMTWKEYALALVVFNGVGILFLMAILMFQGALPLNPDHKTGMSFWLALNTAVSFVTNTNWQAYSGEKALSYFSQMVGLTVQNFLSAAVGVAGLLVLIRGLRQKQSGELGNFWVDMTRCVLWVLLPLSVVFSVVLVNEGVIQNFSPYQKATTLEKHVQVLPMGPVASQVAIKQLGTNGGGYFGTNSAHPYENPTPLSNFLEMLAILLLPVACVFMFARMIGSTRQGIVILSAMLILFGAALALALTMEHRPNMSVFQLPFWEGKEWRFSLSESTLWGVATTAASNGSVNAMHSSFSPLAGLVFMLNMMLGEIVFGGIGCGLYGMIVFVMLTVFLSGLMVGRTPEYLGKKIEGREVIGCAIAALLPGMANLIFSAIAVSVPAGLASLSHSGPHGFSEVLYAFSSGTGNNGSAFAGLNADTPFYNSMMALAMLLGRFGVLIPVLAVAGGLSEKRIIPISSGTLRTDTPLFVVLLVSVIIVVGALTFFPALALGPIVEHVLLYSH